MFLPLPKNTAKTPDIQLMRINVRGYDYVFYEYLRFL